MNSDYGNDSNHQILVEQFNDEFTRTVLPVTIFVGVEIIIGFFGNLLVLYVFLFWYHVCNFRYFVLCLAFTDILSTVTTMPGEVLTQLKWYVYPVREICKIKSFFNMFTVMSEAFCLLTIAIDRYRKVCVPFGWQIRPYTALILCGVIFIISSTIASPVPFLWGTRHVQKVYKKTTITVTICEKDEDQAYTRHVFQYTSAVYVIFSILLTSMFVLYIFVARKLALQGHGISSIITMSTPTSSSVGSSKDFSDASSEVGKSKSRTEMSDVGYSSEQGGKLKASKCNVSSDGGLTTDEEEEPPISTICNTPVQQTKTPKSVKEIPKRKSQKPNKSKRSGNRLRRKTRIMFILTLIFIITTVCYLTLLSLIANDDVLQKMNDTGRAFYFFFFRLYFINHVINPLVYGVLDPHFRKEMKRLKHFCCKCLK